MADFFEDLKTISEGVYKNNPPQNINGWERPKDGDKFNKLIGDKSNGFSAAVYTKGNQVVIAYRGTELKDAGDIRSDNQMARGQKPDQLANAEALYKQVKAAYPGKQIILTGHSLGGSLAQMVAGIHKEAISLIICSCTIIYEYFDIHTSPKIEYKNFVKGPYPNK